MAEVAVFESRLADLYDRLADVFREHGPHPVAPLRLVDELPCFRTLVCTQDVWCENLSAEVDRVEREEFAPEDACNFQLEDLAALAEVRFEPGVTTVKQAIVEALIVVAHHRLFPYTFIPVHP